MSDDAALADLERRRNLVAAELARLSAALDEALGTAEAIEVDDLRPPTPAPRPAAPPVAPPDADITEQLPSLQGADLGAPWQAMLARPSAPATAAPAAPRPARPGRRRARTPAALAGLGVAAVVLLAVLLVLPRAGDGETAAATGDVSEVAVSEVPLVVAPPSAAPEPSAAAPALSPSAPAPSPAPSSSRALDRVLLLAAGSPEPLPAATQALVTRIPDLQRLTGEARAEEAADIYGLAVIAARGEETPGPATALEAALEPEVTFEALDLLARRRPGVVGSGVAPLLPGFAALPDAPAAGQEALAQALLDAMMEGVLGGTISPGFCNVGARVLDPYLPAA